MAEISVPSRRWIGTTIVSIVALFLGFVAVQLSPWLLVPVAVLSGVGILMTWPDADKSDDEGSAFVRGDASGSVFEDVFADGADRFVDGNAIGAVFRRVIHRVRDGGNRAARRKKRK